MPYSRLKKEGVVFFLGCKVKNQFFPCMCKRLHYYGMDFLTYVYVFMLCIFGEAGMMRANSKWNVHSAMHCCSVPDLFRI